MNAAETWLFPFNVCCHLFSQHDYHYEINRLYIRSIYGRGISMYFVVQHVCNMDASKNPQNINLVYRIVTKKIHSLKMSLPDWLAKLLDRKVINSPFLAVYHILLSHRSNVWILTMTMISTMFAFFVPSVFAGLRYFRQLRAGPRNRLSSSFTYNYSVYTACL